MLRIEGIGQAMGELPAGALSGTRASEGVSEGKLRRRRGVFVSSGVTSPGWLGSHGLERLDALVRFVDQVLEGGISVSPLGCEPAIVRKCIGRLAEPVV